MVPTEVDELSHLNGLASAEQRSYLVEVLHWFHFRPKVIDRSWVLEEVLVWELIRAMELLPQGVFLRPLIEKIASLDDRCRNAAGVLQGAARIDICRYPRLRLAGTKRNCRSDIGLLASGRHVIWIEAKTARFKMAEVEEQLAQQADSLAKIAGRMPIALITLLPDGSKVPDIPNLSWSVIWDVLTGAIEIMRREIANDDLRHGYELLAEELRARIASHPNGLLKASKTTGKRREVVAP